MSLESGLYNFGNKYLEKIGYRFVGENSAVKVCHWTKQALRGKGQCYKSKFYGINSHQCVQMSPAIKSCNHHCVFCWRDTTTMRPEFENVDNPKNIVDGCIMEQVKFLQGFKGRSEIDLKQFKEAMTPKHFAISLDGEPTFYPELPELVDEIKSRGFTAYVVTNGTKPEVIEKLLEHEPTQLYVTLPAPNEFLYKKICAPVIRNGWEKIMQSLEMLEQFKCNTVIRLTLVKDINMINPELYAEIIEKYKSKFVEAKAFMSVSFARKRLPFESMPLHNEIMDFAEKITENCSYKIKDEHRPSRVVLMSK